MNDKSKKSGNHYNADESRDLLSIINELRDFLKTTSNTEYKVIFQKEYINQIKNVKKFLKTS
jgi:hypothetical protein